MNQNDRVTTGRTWLGVIALLFALLLLANQANELLKQIVIAPGSAAEIGTAADCRADELAEEGLSLKECQLMVSSVQIILVSSLSDQLVIAGLWCGPCLHGRRVWPGQRQSSLHQAGCHQFFPAGAAGCGRVHRRAEHRSAITGAIFVATVVVVLYPLVPAYGGV